MFDGNLNAYNEQSKQQRTVGMSLEYLRASFGFFEQRNRQNDNTTQSTQRNAQQEQSQHVQHQKRQNG